MAATPKAEPIPVSKEELCKELVQQIAQRDDQVPEKYIYKDGLCEAIDAPDLWRDSLLIDFSLLSSLSPSGRDELAKLRSALLDWGCFQVINHGMERSFLEELLEVSKQFFALPLEEKLKYHNPNNMFEGYGNEFGVEGNKTRNWNDRLFLTLYPEERRNLRSWPETPEKFRGLVDEYSKKVAGMMKEIYKAMARCLDLKEDCFIKEQGLKSVITGRLNLYPRCMFPKRVIGIKPHSDGGTMTVLLPDHEVDGLQVQKDDQWFKVHAVPGALFINLGDLGEIMTNGVFKSPLHRVVANPTKDRISLVAFFTPQEDHEIGPVSELINNHRPQRYKKFSKQELGRVFLESYAQGLQLTDLLKI